MSEEAGMSEDDEVEAERPVEVPTRVDALGRPADPVVVEDEVAASHWDQRRWVR
jgi:hypothetical protein